MAGSYGNNSKLLLFLHGSHKCAEAADIGLTSGKQARGGIITTPYGNSVGCLNSRTAIRTPTLLRWKQMFSLESFPPAMIDTVTSHLKVFDKVILF